jgi:hypothetical protein
LKAAKMTTVAAMEPLLPDDNKELEDLATDLVAKASGLATRLHPVLRASVGDLVRSMNCYYSNLIEGHNTLPVDIDRAMNNELATEPERRNLQLEARAHIEVQRMIDRGEGPSPVMSEAFITWTHRNFCERLPAEMLVVENPESGRKITMAPGVLRSEHVRVGRHIAPDPADLPAFIKRFAEGYPSSNLSRLRSSASPHPTIAWLGSTPSWTATVA